MNILHLTGFGTKISVSKSKLEIRNGRDGITKPYVTSSYRPRRFPYDSITIDGHSGYVTLQAFHWLSRNKIPVFVLNFDGSMISSILPPTPVKADLRAVQFEACTIPRLKLAIAKALVEAKIARSIQVLEWLAERYDLSREVLLMKREAMNLTRAHTVMAVRSVEGRVAVKYWSAYGKVLPEPLDFQGRGTTSRASNASDPVNAALNYGYGFLEGECRKAINTVGLEPSVGFLHDFSDYQTKQSLVYDLQEPFRWLIDLTVMQAFESGTLDVSHFYFTGDDYRYRFDIEAKTRFLSLLRERFNSGVKYNGRVLKWDTVIEQKATELSRFLSGRSREIDFIEPSPVLERSDSFEVRKAILSLTQKQADKLGIGRSTLHYLRRNARASDSFMVYGKIKKRLEVTT
ncbi:MAG: CRISPR-associated endonuclease Cas1 [Candidatus Bathyarchaeia archaeon]